MRQMLQMYLQEIDRSNQLNVSAHHPPDVSEVGHRAKCFRGYVSVSQMETYQLCNRSAAMRINGRPFRFTEIPKMIEAKAESQRRMCWHFSSAFSRPVTSPALSGWGTFEYFVESKRQSERKFLVDPRTSQANFSVHGRFNNISFGAQFSHVVLLCTESILVRSSLFAVRSLRSPPLWFSLPLCRFALCDRSDVELSVTCEQIKRCDTTIKLSQHKIQITGFLRWNANEH